MCEESFVRNAIFFNLTSNSFNESFAPSHFRVNMRTFHVVWEKFQWQTVAIFLIFLPSFHPFAAIICSMVSLKIRGESHTFVNLKSFLQAIGKKIDYARAVKFVQKIIAILYY